MKTAKFLRTTNLKNICERLLLCETKGIWETPQISGQLPPRKIAPQLRLGFGSRSELVLGLGGNQAFAPKENCPPVSIRVWLRVSFGVGRQF